MRGLVVGFGLLLGFAGLAAQARAEDPSFLVIGAGGFDFMEDRHRAAQLGLQYRSDLKLWIFQPMLGASATSDQAAYAYAGVSLDLFFGERVVLRPSFAPGLYRRGHGKDLGHAVEFRSGIEIAYRFDDRSRLGLELTHRSNASLDDRNPGEESLMLTYAFPTAALFGR
ncbi:MAG: acyloxyacyl hydrolase [Pseudomonadota bacterium]